MTDIITYLKSVMDSSESASFGRCGCAFIITNLALWAWWDVVTGYALPDVPWGWVTVIGILWGGTATKDIMTRRGK